jgi:hypothetical protein
MIQGMYYVLCIKLTKKRLLRSRGRFYVHREPYFTYVCYAGRYAGDLCNYNI